ncbi:S9 family peptidase [Nonomuraea turkmeniaca]|uniref:S9 family peptidase n=1 Tax=Nonomuraea turkmeniaca TaxID=103838 RepID=A0A5S4FLH7_9ACTN|nr:S9 family peptidase [Nonomuraea turkmeniaca]TMR21495.1 S9 family peptidase [Nonomuraea turkmeniaca]
MTSPIDVHRALAGMRYPESVALHPEGDRVACVLDGVAHLIGLDGDRTPVPGRQHTLTRWLPGGRLLLASGGDRVEIRSGTTLEPLWQGRVRGEIEDLIPGDDGTVLVRLADPGSERDGSHLGLRVHDPSDPFVRTPGGRLRRLAWFGADGDGPHEIVLPGLSVWDADWRDGRALAVTSEDETPAGYYRPRLDLIDARTGDVRVLHTTSWQLNRPRLAPGGRTAVAVEGLSIVSGRILRADLDTGRVAYLGEVDDVTDLGWLDDQTLWFTGWSGTGVHGGVLSAVDGRVLSHWTAWGTLGGRDGQPSLSVDRSGTLAAAVWETAECPPEVAVAPLGGGDWRPITTENAGLTRLAVRQAEVSWTGDDGQVVSGLLLTRGPAGPRPLVVIAHGGPTWLWSSAFAPAESNQLAVPLAHAGAAVLLPNPRGSSGRGQDYARAVIGRVGEVDLGDLLAGVDHLVKAGVADPERMAVMGLSYGGYLTAWATTRTGRFRAAVVMSGVSDWLSFSTASNLAGGFDPLYHGGADPTTPQGREHLAARSPVYHAAGAATPTLILHGEEDRTTPPGQAEQLYRAWSAAGVSTELVVYPREGHELVEGAHRTDAAQRVIGWLTRGGVL